jgi:hypothetical protein
MAAPARLTLKVYPTWTHTFRLGERVNLNQRLLNLGGRLRHLGANGMDYRIALVCTGVPTHVGQCLASDVAEEFTHRPWHRNVTYEWDGTHLVLIAENDFDPEGKALMDEFSDAICANADGFDGDFFVRSITTLPVDRN